MVQSIKIPDFDENNNLPPGIYSAKLDDVVRRFGGSKSLKRSQLTKNLRLFYNLVRYYAFDIFINGSYVTNKLSPEDIDILVIFPQEFKNEPAFYRYLEFSTNPSKYGLHIFGYLEGDEVERQKEIFETFTHARPENGKREKGIIRLEIKK